MFRTPEYVWKSEHTAAKKEVNTLFWWVSEKLSHIQQVMISAKKVEQNYNFFPAILHPLLILQYTIFILAVKKSIK